MSLNKALLADLPPAQPTNPALRPPQLPGMGLSFVSQADDKDWDRPRRKRAMPYVQRKLNYDNAKRRWKKGGLFGWGRGPKPPAPPAPPPEFAPYVKGVLSWGLAKFFDESKVKRDEDGRFAPKGEGERRSRLTGLAPRERSVASIYSRGPQYEEKDRPEYDWSRSVRPTKDMPFKVRQAYEQYRGELNRNPPAAPERGAKAELPADLAPQLPTAGGGRFKMVDMRPQVPSTMTKDEYAELGAWAGQRTREVRDEHIKRSIGRKDPGGHRGGMLLPVGTDPKDRDVKLAYNMARNLAMHDVGLISYDYRMTPETIQALQPHRSFIKHTRRYLGNILRSERPGVWAQFRREFGKEFADGRTHKFDTAGQKAGEKKKYFERHLNFLKSWNAGALRKAFGNPNLSQAEIEQRRNAAKARWARLARRADERDDAAMKAPKSIRAFAPPGPGWVSRKDQNFDPVETAAMRAELNAVRRDLEKVKMERDSAERNWHRQFSSLAESRIQREKWIAAGKDPAKRPRSPNLPQKLVDLRREVKRLMAKEDELFWRLQPRNIERESGLLWTQKNPVQPSSYDVQNARWAKRSDLRIYEKEGEYEAAEQAHRQRVKDVRSGKTRSFKPSMPDAPAAPAAPRMTPPKSPRLSFGGKAALVGAGVLGAGALGYGIARWRQGSSLGKAATGFMLRGAGKIGLSFTRGSSPSKVWSQYSKVMGRRPAAAAPMAAPEASRRQRWDSMRQHWKANARQGALSAGLLGGAGAALYATRERKPQREAI